MWPPRVHASSHNFYLMALDRVLIFLRVNISESLLLVNIVRIRCCITRRRLDIFSFTFLLCTHLPNKYTQIFSCFYQNLKEKSVAAANVSVYILYYRRVLIMYKYFLFISKNLMLYNL